MANDTQKTVSQLAIEKEFKEFQRQNNVLAIVAKAKENAYLLEEAAQKFVKIATRIKGNVAEADFAFAAMDIQELKSNFQAIKAYNEMLINSDLFDEVREEFGNEDETQFEIPEELQLNGDELKETVSA